MTTWQIVQSCLIIVSALMLCVGIFFAFKTDRLVKKWRAEVAALTAETTIAERLAAHLVTKLKEEHGVQVEMVEVEVKLHLAGGGGVTHTAQGVPVVKH